MLAHNLGAEFNPKALFNMCTTLIASVRTLNYHESCSEERMI